MRYAEKMFKLPNPDFFVVYVGKKELPKEQELRLSDAFYQKDNSKLELVVKLVNCSDSQTLPLCGTCDILVDYLEWLFEPLLLSPVGPFAEWPSPACSGSAPCPATIASPRGHIGNRPVSRWRPPRDGRER